MVDILVHHLQLKMKNKTECLNVQIIREDKTYAEVGLNDTLN